MKELILLRHAKSSWEYSVEDRNRSLTENGVHRIKAIAHASASHFEGVDVVFSSPANRAFHTASILMHELNLPFEKLIINERLYTFEVSQVVQFVRSLPTTYAKVVCVGHNPAYTAAVSTFSSESLPHLPTAGWVSFQFDQSDWKNIEYGKVNYGLPKELLQ